MNNDIQKHKLLENKYKLQKKMLRKEICLAWIKRKEAKLNMKKQRKIQAKLKREIIFEKIEDPQKKTKFKTKLLKTESKIATLDYKLNDLKVRIKEKTKETEDIAAEIADIENEVSTIGNHNLGGEESSP